MMTCSFDRMRRLWAMGLACVIMAGCAVKTDRSDRAATAPKPIASTPVAQKPVDQAAIADLTRSARTLINERKDQEALAALDRILAVDPKNEYASGVRPLVADRAARTARGASTGPVANPVALQTKVPLVRLDAVGLIDAIDFLRDVTDANIQVRWREFEQVGIDPRTRVRAMLKDETLEQALREILNRAGAEKAVIGYSADKTAITISIE